jgi:hypothetical protein
VTDLDSLVHELCKYITKSDSWERLNKDVLVEAALTRRWWRMFELYGSFSKKVRDRADSDSESLEEAPIVHTSFLSDGSASHFSDSWRDEAIRMEPDDYKGFLILQVEAAIQVRRELLSNRWTFSTLLSLSELLEENCTDDTPYAYSILENVEILISK